MEGFLMLFMLSLTMFIGSYISGSVPLAMSFSEGKLRFVTVFGAGLLVGTALAVIIPEGVQSIYDAQPAAHHHGHHDHAAAAAAAAPATAVDGKKPEETAASAADLLKVPLPRGQQTGEVPPPVKQIPDVQSGGSLSDNHTQKRRKRAIEASSREESDRSRTARDTSHVHVEGEAAAPGGGLRVDNLIGMALVFGFVFMLCVDQISAASQRSAAGDVAPRYKLTATVGLVVHSAADGIALGAASTTNQTEIQFIVFLAIMLHKAPAAFGLSTFLLYEGLEPSRIRRHLLVFALAAPVCAVFTFIGIVQGGSSSLSSQTSTGVLMLFSAGTFLYVATVHVLPEIVQQQSQQGKFTALPQSDGGLEAAAAGPHGHSHSGASFKLNELAALVTGAIVPVFLSLGHSHSH